MKLHLLFSVLILGSISTPAFGFDVRSIDCDSSQRLNESSGVHSKNEEVLAQICEMNVRRESVLREFDSAINQLGSQLEVQLNINLIGQSAAESEKSLALVRSLVTEVEKGARVEMHSRDIMVTLQNKNASEIQYQLRMHDFDFDASIPGVGFSKARH